LPQRKEGYDQVELTASALGYGHYFHDSMSESHIDTNCRLGQCVISRYPISQHRFGLFENPNALESRTAQGILQDVAGKLVPARDKALIQGDFNIDRPGVQPYLRQLFARAGLAEVAIDEPKQEPAGARHEPGRRNPSRSRRGGCQVPSSI